MTSKFRKVPWDKADKHCERCAPLFQVTRMMDARGGLPMRILYAEIRNGSIGNLDETKEINLLMGIDLRSYPPFQTYKHSQQEKTKNPP